MDSRDKEIFNLLCEDPFITGAEVSRRTGLPLPTAIRRLKSLRKRIRVIVEPPYEEMGLGIEALIFVEGEPMKINEEVERIEVAGNWNYILRVRVRDMKHLNEVVSELSKGVKNISTLLIVDRVIKCIGRK